jgi:hypothetical protein
MPPSVRYRPFALPWRGRSGRPGRPQATAAAPRLQRSAIRASAELGITLSAMRQVPAAYGPTPEDEKEPPTRPDFRLPSQVERYERHPQLMPLSTDDDRPLD